MLLSENNFEEVTTELIASRAKVGKEMLYTYFKSKDYLLGEILLYVLSEFLNATVFHYSIYQTHLNLPMQTSYLHRINDRVFFEKNR